MRGLILALFFISVSVSSNAQWVHAGDDTTVCLPNAVNLHATVFGVRGTSNYTFDTIPFAPYPYVGTVPSSTFGDPFTSCDDCVSNAIPIGFDFCFLNQTYADCYIGTNGWISFSPNQSSSYTSQSIPSTDPNVPKNCIMGPWQDWYPGGGGNGGAVKYQTIGSAPNRIFVVTWDHVPMFSCTNIIGTFQIAIFETTNEIQNFIEVKPNCPAWAGGTATQGVHNASGTSAFLVPGRNSTAWITSNEGKRFKPSGVEWYSNGVLVGYGDNLTVTPTTTTVYTAVATLCDGTVAVDSMTVFAGALTSSLTTVNPLCNGSGAGSASLNTNGTAFNYTFLWTDALNDTLQLSVTNSNDNISQLSGGNYFVHVVGDDGCFFDTSFTIVEPPAMQRQISKIDVLCNGFATGVAGISVSGGTTPYSYSWSTNPVQTLDTIQNLYAGMYYVTVTDSNNCTINDSVEVTQPTMLLAEGEFFDDTCGTGNGFAISSANGGVSPYQFQWNDALYQSTNYAIDLPRGVYSVLITDAHGCTTSVSDSIRSGYKVESNFTFSPENVFLYDPRCQFTDYSRNALAWQWYFGDGDSSIDQNPLHYYQTHGKLEVILVTFNEYGCTDTLRKPINVEGFFNMFLPKAFTPNADGKNDFLFHYSAGVETVNFKWTILNRWGNEIFSTNDFFQSWNGLLPNGDVAPAGTYTYVIEFTDFQFEKHKDTGHFTVIY